MMFTYNSTWWFCLHLMLCRNTAVMGRDGDTRLSCVWILCCYSLIAWPLGNIYLTFLQFLILLVIIALVFRTMIRLIGLIFLRILFQRTVVRLIWLIFQVAGMVSSAWSTLLICELMIKTSPYCLYLQLASEDWLLNLHFSR